VPTGDEGVLVGPGAINTQQAAADVAQVVSSCSRPGRTPEVHSGHLSGADRTWMLPPWGLCLPDHPLPQAGGALGRPRWGPGWTPGRCALWPVSPTLGF